MTMVSAQVSYIKWSKVSGKSDFRILLRVRMVGLNCHELLRMVGDKQCRS